jgi:hypothetical protein
LRDPAADRLALGSQPPADGRDLGGDGDDRGSDASNSENHSRNESRVFPFARSIPHVSSSSETALSTMDSRLSSHATTFGLGPGLTTSLMTFVSIRKPFIAPYRTGLAEPHEQKAR